MKNRKDMNVLEDILPRCRAAVRLLSGLAALCCASCANEYAESLVPDTRGVTLALKVSILERAAFETSDPVEYMGDLRVIITSENDEGKECVEYNRYIDFGDGKVFDTYGYANDEKLKFKLTDGTKTEKHIYLFANSEPILAGLNIPDPENKQYNSGADVTPVEAETELNKLRELTYTNDQLQGWVKDDNANGIPMSAEYDVTVDLNQKENKKELYIVRAADKITFQYVNKRSSHPLFVQNWELRNVADKAYLLPRVNTTENEALLDGKDWITWYREHSEASNTDQETGDAFHNGELAFSVPDGVSYKAYNGVASGNTYTANNNVENETVTGLQLPSYDFSGNAQTVTDEVTYYFPETRYIPADDKQAYTMTFKTREYDTGGSEGQRYTTEVTYDGDEHTGIPLPRVTTLFRNTHVKIKATFQEHEQVSILASVYNWIELGTFPEKLKPEGGSGSQSEPGE